MNKTNENLEEVIVVSKDSLPVCCPLKEQAHWNQHPRVYLSFSQDKKASCPYCGNRFELKNN